MFLKGLLGEVEMLLGVYLITRRSSRSRTGKPNYDLNFNAEYLVENSSKISKAWRLHRSAYSGDSFKDDHMASSAH